VMTPTHLVIVRIVCRRDLDSAGAKLRIDVLVGNDRDLAIGEWQEDCLAHEFAVTIVSWIYGDGSVAKHCFRPRGCDRHTPVTVLNLILKVIKFACLRDTLILVI